MLPGNLKRLPDESFILIKKSLNSFVGFLDAQECPSASFRMQFSQSILDIKIKFGGDYGRYAYFY